MVTHRKSLAALTPLERMLTGAVSLRPPTRCVRRSVAVTLLICLDLVSAASLHNRRAVFTDDDAAPQWHSPCAGTDPVDIEIEWESPGEDSPHHERFEIIGTHANEAKQLVHQLMATYVLERFGDPLFPLQLETFKIEGMPEVRNLTIIPHHNPSSIDVRESIQRTYDDLSRVAVFLEHAIEDELTYETEYGTSMHEFIQRIQEHYVFPLLCQLQTTMYAHEAEVDLRVTREVMLQSSRDLSDRSLRHTRDYIIFRDLERVLHFVEVEFMLLRDHYTNVFSRSS